MTVTFNAKVVGDIPANRLCILGGRDEEDNILLKIADNQSSADFVSTRALVDGELTEVTLKSGVNIWNVEAALDVLAGQWVSCREDGKVGHRSSETVENIGFTLEPAKQGEIAKVVRRESVDNHVIPELRAKLAELETTVATLAGGEGGA